jgi:hypothetical protein
MMARAHMTRASARQVWKPHRCVHLEKTPANLVWAPHVAAWLHAHEGVPPSQISVVLLTRSPCAPPASVLNDTAGWRTKHNRDLRLAFPGLGADAGVERHEQAWLNLTA